MCKRTRIPITSALLSSGNLFREIIPEKFLSTRWLQTSSVMRYDDDLYSQIMNDGDTKYYFDLKAGARKYVKISELSRGKRATTMIDLEDVSMFVARLLEAEGGEKVEMLQSATRNKTYDFALHKSAEESKVMVTETTKNRPNAYKVYLTSAIIPDVIKFLIHVSEKYAEPSKDSH